MIEVIVNGSARKVKNGCSVAELLQELGVGEGRVAVERNRAIVRRAEHASTPLSAGDALEVVHFVGGG